MYRNVDVDRFLTRKVRTSHNRSFLETIDFDSKLIASTERSRDSATHTQVVFHLETPTGFTFDNQRSAKEERLSACFPLFLPSHWFTPVTDHIDLSL